MKYLRRLLVGSVFVLCCGAQTANASNVQVEVTVSAERLSDQIVAVHVDAYYWLEWVPWEGGYCIGEWGICTVYLNVQAAGGNLSGNLVYSDWATASGTVTFTFYDYNAPAGQTQYSAAVSVDYAWGNYAGVGTGSHIVSALDGDPPGEGNGSSVLLCSDADFGGTCTAFTETSAFVGWDANDTTSSVVVPSGWTVILYLHADFQGDYLVLTGNEANLYNIPGPGLNDTWDETISSLEIIKP